MNKTKIIKDIAKNLNSITASLEVLIEVLDKTSATEKVKSASVENVIPTTKSEPIPIEKVRAVLATKSQGGKQPEVKALIIKYGANNLTDIDPSHFEALLKEAEEL